MNSPTIFGSEDLPEGGLVQVSWNKSMECGHPVIDGQHRRLFGLANEAIDTLLAKGPKVDEETLLKQLVEQLQTHFITEETLLARAFDPRLDEHRAEHMALLTEAKAMLKRFHDGEVISKDLVAFLSNDVISDHIIREDISMVAGLT
jgi:hemerythrin-like metal-binding protein